MLFSTGSVMYRVVQLPEPNVMDTAPTSNGRCSLLFDNNPPGGSEWIMSVGDYIDNSFTALGSSDPREVRLELGFYVFHFRFVQVQFVFC